MIGTNSDPAPPPQFHATVPSEPVGQTPVAPKEIAFPWANTHLTSPPVPPGCDSFPPYFRVATGVFPRQPNDPTCKYLSLGVVITPGLVTDVPVIDRSDTFVVRCTECAAYLCPFTPVLTNGHTFKCPFCGSNNDVQKMDSKVKIDSLQSFPEVTAPVYDILPPPPYVSNKNICKAFCFILDTSMNAYGCGFTAQFASSLRSLVATMDEKAKVVLITAAEVPSVWDLERRQEYLVSDMEDHAMKDIVRVIQIGKVRQNMMDILEEIEHRQPPETAVGCCLPAAMMLAEELMKETGGIVAIGCVDIPNVGPHPLNLRHGGTELQMLKLPEDGTANFYRDIAFKYNKASISCHVFTALSQMPTNDLACVGVPAGLTGGSVHSYGTFTVERRQELHTDLFNLLTAEYLWSCSVRLRCSAGVKIGRMHGNFVVQNRNLIWFPVLEKTRACSFELLVDKELSTPYVLLQMGMLWTTDDSRRMLRVFTFRFPISTNYSAIKNSIDEGALTTLIVKRAIFNMLTSGLEPALMKLKNEVIALVANGIPAESIFHLIHSFFVSKIGTPGAAVPDEKVAFSVWLRSAPIIEMLLYLYPRMFALDSRSGPLPCEGNSFAMGRVFLFHTSNKVYIWVSSDADRGFLTNVFGVNTVDAEQFPTDLPELGTSEAAYVQEKLQECWTLSGHYLPLEIIPQGSPREAVFGSLLVDSPPGMDSFSDWLQKVKTAQM